MTVDTKDMAAAVAYLIGVRKHIIDSCFGDECGETLERLYADHDAAVIRYLCKMRTTLLLKFRKTDDELRYNLKNLDRIEWFDTENILCLEEWGINVIKPNYRSEQYIFDITNLIAENIDNCRNLFYDWVSWDYIKDLFFHPRYRKPNVLKKEFEKRPIMLDMESIREEVELPSGNTKVTVYCEIDH